MTLSLSLMFRYMKHNETQGRKTALGVRSTSVSFDSHLVGADRDLINENIPKSPHHKAFRKRLVN